MCEEVCVWGRVCEYGGVLQQSTLYTHTTNLNDILGRVGHLRKNVEAEDHTHLHSKHTSWTPGKHWSPFNPKG